jgi:hypothetical protein
VLMRGCSDRGACSYLSYLDINSGEEKIIGTGTELQTGSETPYEQWVLSGEFTPDSFAIDPQNKVTLLYDPAEETSKIVSFNEDARLFFARPPSMKYDLILGDAFNHYSVPYHITTKEFNDRVRVWLADGGLYVINIIDGPQGAFMRAYVNTLRQTFKYVYLAPGMD